MERQGGLQCRRCKRAVRLEGDPFLPQSLRKAVHADDGLEQCPGGEHLAAPVSSETAVPR